MKKLNKILLSPMPIIAALPAITFATSCSEFDYAAAEKWFTPKYEEAKVALKDAGKETPLMKIGLEELGDLELALLHNKKRQYIPKTICNLRKELYGDDESWDHIYGGSAEERQEIFIPMKNEKIANGKWVVTGLVEDPLHPEYKYFNLIQDSTGSLIDYYRLVSILNAYVTFKGDLLKESIGWEADIVAAAQDLSEGKEVLPSLHVFEILADVDASNIGNMYCSSKDQYNSITLCAYKYFTELPNDNNKSRYLNFYNNTLKLNLYWEEDKKLDVLMNRMANNYYIIAYIEERTKLKWDENGKIYIRKATQILLRAIEELIKQ